MCIDSKSVKMKSYNFLLLLFVIGYISSETIENVQQVLDNVLTTSKYNNMIRGKYDLQQKTKIEVNFRLLNIQKLNEVEGWIEVMGVIYVSWTDERLVWNPDNYNGTAQITVHQNLIWRPEVLLSNPSDNVALLSEDRLPIKVFSNGTVTYSSGDVFRSSCAMDVTSFPWDRQMCSLNFIVLGYSPSEIVLHCPAEEINTDYLQTNDVWSFESTRITTLQGPSISELQFHITMDRRPLYFVVTIILPIVAMCFLNLFVFLLPIESGERVSYSITVLLSITVFLTLVGDILPRSSDTMASICYFLLFILSMSCLICLYTIISIRFYYKSNSEPPKCSLSFCKCQRMKKSKISKYSENDQTTNNGTIDTAEDFEDDETAKDKDFTWKIFTVVLDNFCLLICLLLMILSFSVYTYHVIIGRKD